MDIEDKTHELMKRVRLFLNMIREGRYSELNLASIADLDPEMAEGLNLLIGNIDTVGKELNTDVIDLFIIKDHLDHISQTTESGVLSVINTAETVMSESNAIRDSLDTIQHYTAEMDNSDIDASIDNANQVIDSVQNNCFSILTSLELEDINRQLMERIVKRLDEIQGNLLQLLANFNIENHLDKKDSVFLESLKHIVDLEDNSRQSQEDIDDLFEDFGA